MTSHARKLSREPRTGFCFPFRRRIQQYVAFDVSPANPQLIRLAIPSTCFGFSPIAALNSTAATFFYTNNSSICWSRRALLLTELTTSASVNGRSMEFITVLTPPRQPNVPVPVPQPVPIC
jgi:hypothetical protein